MRALWVGLISVSLQAEAASFDVVAAFTLLHQRAGLPTLAERRGQFSLLDRPGVEVRVDRKNGFMSWTEGERHVAFAVFRTAKKTFVAIRSTVEGTPGGETSLATTFDAWSIDPTTKAIDDAPEVETSLPSVAAFVDREDAAGIAQLTKEDVAPWLSRVVRLPREGLTVEVSWSTEALARDCGSDDRKAPELLCTQLTALKFGVRRATWNRATATFEER